MQYSHSTAGTVSIGARRAEPPVRKPPRKNQSYDGRRDPTHTIGFWVVQVTEDHSERMVQPRMHSKIIPNGPTWALYTSPVHANRTGSANRTVRVRGRFHVKVVSFSRKIVSSRIPFVSCLYSIVFQNMKNTVRIQSTRYVLTHALYHHFSNTV